LSEINKDYFDIVVEYASYAITSLPNKSLHSLANNLLSQYTSLSQSNIFLKLLLLFPEIKWDLNITEQFAISSLMTPSSTKSLLLKLLNKPSFLSDETLGNLKPHLVPLVRSSDPETLQYAIPLFSKSAQTSEVTKDDIIALQDVLYEYPRNAYEQEMHGEVLSKAIDAIGDLTSIGLELSDDFVEDLFDFVCFPL
jgi:hypothetical protein